jgi:predicted ArsR family transcriptional regulator
LRIVAALTKDGRNYVSQLARELGISRPLLHLHLQKLEEAGALVRRQGAQLFRSRQIRFRAHPGGYRGRRQIAHRFKVKGKAMSPTIYFISMGAMFGTIIIVFGIRFLQASAVAGADAAHTDAYRKLASDAVTAQAGNAATLSAIQSELAEIKTRLSNVEKILKTVE